MYTKEQYAQMDTLISFSADGYIFIYLKIDREIIVAFIK